MRNKNIFSVLSPRVLGTNPNETKSAMDTTAKNAREDNNQAKA